MEQIQMVAGSVAGLIFAAASWNMLIKAWRTKDLRSYSLSQIVLNNIGNLFYWLYVISLPFGPIYFMHAFFTLASLLMLFWYFIYMTESKKRKGKNVDFRTDPFQHISQLSSSSGTAYESRQQEIKGFRE